MNDSRLPFVREVTAGLLALTVMLMFFYLMNRALGTLPSGAKAADFVPIKELLAIVNPVVGLIIGYYFSRATTEARAEKAEEAAKTANDTANKAQQTATVAEQGKTEAQAQAQNVKGALQSLVGAVEGSRIHSDGERASSTDEVRARAAQLQLLLAIERARGVLG
jgi:hypothetical protein